jgi:hypothetical protein
VKSYTSGYKLLKILVLAKNTAKWHCNLDTKVLIQSAILPGILDNQHINSFITRALNTPAGQLNIWVIHIRTTLDLAIMTKNGKQKK